MPGFPQAGELGFDAAAFQRWRGARVGDVGEQVGQGLEGQPEGGQGAAVDGMGQSHVCLPDQRHEHVADADLQRMIQIQITRQRPTAPSAHGEHIGVLTAAVAVQGGRFLVGAYQRFLVGFERGRLGTTLKRAGVQMEVREQGGDTFRMHGFAVVGRHHDRQVCGCQRRLFALAAVQLVQQQGQQLKGLGGGA